MLELLGVVTQRRPLPPLNRDVIFALAGSQSHRRRASHRPRICAPRSDDTDARKEPRRCFGRSDRSAQHRWLLPR
jgi:hypothetical protein